MSNKISGLLDTNILIDIMRGYGPALAWMSKDASFIFGLPVLVRIELLYGARNNTEMKKLVAFLSKYPIVHVEREDSEFAMTQFEKYHLSHQVEINDCFIGAMSFRLNVPVYTRNMRDFNVLDSVTAHTPYS